MDTIDSLLENNQAFAAGLAERHLDVEPQRHLAIVTCMDSRLDVFAALGLGHGEAHVLRNAGGVITDDVIRSLAISQRKLGTREVMLIHHDDCGMQKITDDGFRMELQETTGIAPSFAIESFDDVDEDVRQSIRRVRASPFLPHRDVVRGFVYDVDTHRLREVEVAGVDGARSPPTAPGPRRSRRRRWPGPGGGWPFAAIAADGAVWWAEGRPERGRPRRADAARPGAASRKRSRRRAPTCAPGCTSTAAAPGAWSRPTSSSSSTSPTSASTGSGWARRRWRSRPSRRARGALRYADMRPTPDGDAIVCVRERDDRGRTGERDRPAAARRLRRAAGAGRAAATSTPSRASAPTAAGSPGPAGTTRTCPGTEPSCGSRRWRTAARSGWSPAAPRSRSSSPNGARTGASTSSPTATAGGTSTAAASPAPS